MDFLFTFRNTHHAIRSENVLVKENIPVFVMPLPSSIGDCCGICLRVSAEDITRAEKSLTVAKIPFAGIFTISQVEGEKVYQSWKI